MSSLRALVVRLRSVVRRTAVERELDEELSFHIERETERRVAAGMPLAAARAAVRREFGNVGDLKERSRDARGVRAFNDMVRDLAYAIRLARRQPLFAAVVIVSLALGLGAAGAVFNLTYNVLFAELDVPRPAELRQLARAAGADRDVVFSRREFEAIRSLPSVGTFAAVRTASQIAVQLGKRREYVNMHFVDGAFFPMLGLRGGRGHFITPGDDAGRLPVAVLSASFAERIAPGDSTLVGRTIEIRGVPFTIIGITPRGYRGLEFPGQFAAAIPMSTVGLLDRAGPRGDDRGVPLDPAADRAGTRRLLKIVGRIHGDGAAARAAILRTVLACCSDGAAAGADRIDLIEIRRGITSPKDNFRQELGTMLLVLLACMLLLVVVVCCNVASLLLVRAATRAREMAVRLSLGATRARLVRQLVLETAPVALAGGVGSLFVAGGATAALGRSVPEWNTYSELVAFGPTPHVLVFGGVATLLCAVAFSVYPALRATRSMRIGSRAPATRQRGTVARGVVVAQVALGIVLVTAGSLLAVTLRNLRHVDGGFATDRVLLASLETRGTAYETRGVGPLHADVLAAVRAVPGVTSAAVSTMIPMYGGNVGWLGLDVPGYVVPRGEQRPTARFIGITPGYFRTLGIPLRAGRDFDGTESPRTAPAVIVSAEFARRYLGGAGAVGRSFRAQLGGDSLSAVRVVGVASDAKYDDLRDAPEPIIYLPFAQTTERWSNVRIAARTEPPPASVAAALLHAFEAAAPGVRVGPITDMHERLDVALSLHRLAMQLATFAGLMVLALCAMGLYGVVAYGVQRRTSEIGVRMALGADASVVVRLIAGETARVVAAGIALGVALSVAANGVIASQLFGVGARDPVVMAFAALVFALVGLAACAVPALRAARIPPSIALAAE
jgi:predicted permease